MRDSSNTAISRRGALAFGAGALAASLFPAPAIAQRFKRVRLASAWSRNLPIFFDLAQGFADQVTLASDGRIRVEHFASNELVGPRDLLAATSEGAIDAYHAFDYFWGQSDATAYLFSGVPFGLTLADHQLWLESQGQSFWQQWGQRHGVVPMLLGGFDQHAGLWMSNEGLERAGASLANGYQVQRLEGLKIRAAGLAGKLVEGLGGTTQQMPLTLLAEALQRGALDAVSSISPGVDSWLGVDRVAAGLAGPAVFQPMQSMTLGFNLGFWNKLDEAEQALVQSVAAAVSTQFIETQRFAHLGLKAEWNTRTDLQRAGFSGDVLLSASNQTTETLASMAEGRPEMATVLADRMAFQQTVAAARGSSGNDYDQALARVKEAEAQAEQARQEAERAAAKAAEAEKRAQERARQEAARRAAQEAARAEAERQALEAQRQAQLLAQRQAEELARQQAILAQQQALQAQQQALQAQQLLQQQQLLVPNVSTQGIAGGLDSPY